MNSAEDNQDELTSNDEVAEPPSGEVRRSAGSMLMAQRETLELSVKQVADQLHLTMHFIRAIESDSYEKLPGDVFVRGYIRTYARLLQLDPDQVLMIYDEFNSHKIARKEEAIKRRNRRRKDKNRPWILVSGIAFVSVAVALWYFNAGDSPDAVADAAPDLDASVVMQTPVTELPATSVGQASASADSAGITPPVMETATPAPEGASPDLSAAEQSANPAAGWDLAADQAAENFASSAGEAVVQEQAGETIVESWAGTDELRIGFRNNSAVQIEHTGGSETHQHNHAAGETLVIRGTAPFSVLLDDARNISLSFNGRQIDISSNIRVDNSARLSIGM